MRLRDGSSTLLCKEWKDTSILYEEAISKRHKRKNYKCMVFWKKISNSSDIGAL